MNIDMYGEKVAEASALIREFAHAEYYHYFAINMEASLEAFIAMMDSCREEGRVKGRSEALAELHPQWLGQKERADKLQAQLEEAESLIAQTSHGAAERISELEAQVAWQPIETAPKNGSEVLLWLPAPYSRIAKARWFGRLENWQEGEYPSIYDEYCGIGNRLPTHWMPIPAAPSTVEG